jgi:hypothetical protein
MPQRAFTEYKNKKVSRPGSKFRSPQGLNLETKEIVPQSFQVELRDSKNKVWYMDQAERFNSFNFNRFRDWECNAGFQGVIIREPDGSIKRGYSCNDQPLGNIETGFKLFDRPTECISESCVSSADSKIPKRKKINQIPVQVFL